MQGIIIPQIFQEHSYRLTAFFTTKGFLQEPLVFLREKISAEALLLMPLQKHTDIVIKADEAPIDSMAVADAVIVRNKGIFIGIKTADCVPLLVYDPLSLSAACVHAGWRGTAQSIVAKTLTQMIGQYGASIGNVLVAIGPSIRDCCYEVGHDVAAAVVGAVGSSECLVAREGRLYLDLQRANAIQAIKAGVSPSNIWICEECTYCSPDKYHSYRYSKHKDKGMRQFGIIGMI